MKWTEKSGGAANDAGLPKCPPSWTAHFYTTLNYVVVFLTLILYTLTRIITTRKVKLNKSDNRINVNQRIYVTTILTFDKN